MSEKIYACLLRLYPRHFRETYGDEAIQLFRDRSEEFRYDLKNLKRATIFGEPTGGGAHLMVPHEIDDRFVLDVPFGRPINPISKKDWEGTGVQPDVEVQSSKALETAVALARNKQV